MYPVVLILHSWLRWLALGAGVGATAAAGNGSPARAEGLGLLLMMTLDIQMLLGVLLYGVLSPAQGSWAVGHVGIMVTAVVAVHAGRVMARKAGTPDAKRTRMLVAFGAATLMMLLGIPWPGLAGGRPLFRF
jgi:hypothetical protein